MDIREHIADLYLLILFRSTIIASSDGVFCICTVDENDVVNDIASD